MYIVSLRTSTLHAENQEHARDSAPSHNLFIHALEGTRDQTYQCDPKLLSAVTDTLLRKYIYLSAFQPFRVVLLLNKYSYW